MMGGASNDEAVDFSCCYASRRFSDATVVIFEERNDMHSLSHAEDRLEEALPAHCVVLLACSPYCRAKLDHWLTDGEQGNICIEIAVPAGQLELGKLLIKGMYFATLDLSRLTQQQLLQLMVLADRYEVPKVLGPVGRRLSEIPPAALHWDSVMTIYLLQSASFAGNEHCSKVFSNAAAALQSNLGDLEAAWNDDSGIKQQRMIELPFIALQQLLKSSETAVHSENTVLYTIEQWHQHQLHQTHESFTTSQLQQLLALTRMRHCSQQYLMTAASPGTVVEKCLTSSELVVAAALASSDGIFLHQWSRMQELCHPLPTRYPAWSAEQRPASAVQQGVIDWQISVSTLQQMVQQHLHNPTAAVEQHGSIHVLQGRRLQLTLRVPGSEDQSVYQVLQRSFAMSLSLLDMTESALCAASCTLTILTLQQAAKILPVPVGRCLSLLFLKGSANTCDWHNVLHLGPISSLPDIQEKLRKDNKLLPVDGSEFLSNKMYIHFRCLLENLQ